MKLHVLPAGPIQTNAYLLTAADRGEAILIDAPGEVFPEVKVRMIEEKCRLKEIWITHGHWDHMQGGAEVVKYTGARVRAHPADQALLETPHLMKRFLSEPLDPLKVDTWIEHGQSWEALGLQVEVRHTPGHCPGNVLFYFPAARAAFVGDTLFSGSIGRTDLPGGDSALLEKSIREQIFTLPDETTVFPGHGPSTTVGRERRENPYLRP